MVVPNSTFVAKKSAYSHSGLMVSVIPIDFRITLCTGEMARATIRFTPNCFNNAMTNRDVPKSFPNTTNTTSTSVKGNVCNACSFFTSNATVFVMESLYKCRNPLPTLRFPVWSDAAIVQVRNYLIQIRYTS